MLHTVWLGVCLAVSTGQAQTPAAPPAALAAPALADAYYQFLQARTLEAQKDLNGAVAAYRKVLELAPASAEIHADLAELYATNGRLDAATPELDAALKIDPANRSAHRLYGLIDAALADNAQGAQRAPLVREAIAHLEQANASAVGHDLNVLLTLGQLYLETHQIPKSIAVLKIFLIDEPDYPDALTTLSEAYDAANQTSDAIATLEHLTVVDPTIIAASSRLAELYEQAGRWAEAAARWDALAKQTPRNAPQFQARRATDLINAGDFDAARSVLQSLTKDNPKDSTSWYLLVQLEKRAGNAAAVEAAAHQLIAIDAADPRGTLSLADAKVLGHDYRGAIGLLQPLYDTLMKSTAADSPIAEVTEALSSAFQESGDTVKALQVVEDVHRRMPDDEDMTLMLASAYERAGKVDEAETLLRGLVAKAPADATALNALGYLLADHGRKLDEAVGLIQRALAGDADNPSYLDSLGWAYFKQGKYADAVGPLEHAAGALRGNSAIQAHLGDLYFQLKRYADAAGAWTRALGGDQSGIDVAAVTKKRDRARELAK